MSFIFNPFTGTLDYFQASSSAVGINTATEQLSGTQSGSNVTLNLTTLSHSFVAILFVTRNGQILTPNDTSLGYTISGNTVTIYNADASEPFLVTYTY